MSGIVSYNFQALVSTSKQPHVHQINANLYKNNT